MISDPFDHVQLLMGHAVSGPVLTLGEPISFWGGVCPKTGTVLDTYHPQFGVSLRGTVLFMPVSKGSTAGPGALLELIFAGLAPTAIITPAPDLSVLTAAFMAQSLGLPAPAVAIERVGALADIDSPEPGTGFS